MTSRQVESMRTAGGSVTLAEHLAAAGYRTAAITDGAFVSADYGLDQGFDTYHDVPTSGAGGVYPQRRGDDVCDAAILELNQVVAYFACANCAAASLGLEIGDGQLGEHPPRTEGDERRHA